MIYVYPILILLATVFLFVSRLKKRKLKSEFLDIGIVFVAVLLIYGFMPGAGFLFAHLGIGQIMDQRLSGGFNVEYVEYIQWMHLFLLLGFSTAYFLKNNLTVFRFDSKISLDAKFLLRPVFFLVLIASLIPSLLINFWGGDAATDYISSYTVLRSAPLLVQQVYGVLSQLQFSAIVAFVVIFIAAKPEKHVWVAIVLGLNMIFSAISGGSRTLAFLAFFSYIASCSIFVQGFSWKKILIFVIPALFLFMIAGMFRDKSDEAGFLYLFQTGEFTVLFVNAVDLKERFAAGWGDEVGLAFYFVDVLRLIPSQLLGGVKLDPAQWYAETFYPDYFDAGGGFAFGILSESATGFGVPEAFLRGLLLGFIFRFLRHKLMNSGASVVRVFIYVWMIVLCYQSYRDTTFSLAVRALYQLLPMLLMINFFSRAHPTAKTSRQVCA